MSERSISKGPRAWFQLGRRTKYVLAGLVVVVAVVPSFWLAVLEQRSNAHLIDEVDRGLESDASFFIQLLTDYTDDLLIDEQVLPILDRPGYVVADTSEAGGAFYEVEVPDTSAIAYPFLIDLADTSFFPGRAAEEPDELRAVYRQGAIREELAAGRRRGRGYVAGPYGPFHYAFTVVDGTGAGAPVVRGVKVDPAAVRWSVLSAAYERLVERVIEERGPGVWDHDVFGLQVVADTAFTLRGLAGADEAIGVMERPLEVGGLFPEWRVQVHYLNQLKAGQWRRNAAIIVPLVIVVLGVVVTARLAMREAELNEVKSLFVSNVSHELKTPLAKIQLFNDLLASLPPEGSDKKARYHSVIRDECERLTRLINNVLNLGRIERGEANYEFTDVALEEVVSGVAEAFNALYGSNGYGLDLRMDAGLPILYLDPGAIEQALINLTDNAVKYSNEPHTLVMHVTHSRMQGRPAVAVAVTDRGVGIPEAKLKLIFEEFYRVKDGGARRAGGSGLGLALVRHIVAAHGGRIDVESEVGAGSTFTILLPAQAPTKADGAPPRAV